MIKVLLTVLFVGVVYSACPNGWEHGGRFCFLISRDNATWPGALTICEYLGGTIVEVTKVEVQNFLVAKLEESKYSAGNAFWIDGNDFAEENTFVDRRGYALQYHNWRPGQPNNQWGNEECVSIRRNDGFNYTWNDEPCEVLNNYICQRSYTSGGALFG